MFRRVLILTTSAVVLVGTGAAPAPAAGPAYGKSCPGSVPGTFGELRGKGYSCPTAKRLLGKVKLGSTGPKLKDHRCKPVPSDPVYVRCTRGKRGIQFSYVG